MNQPYEYGEAVRRTVEYLHNGLRNSMVPDHTGKHMLIAGNRDLKLLALAKYYLRQNPCDLFSWASADAEGFQAARLGVADALERGEGLPKEAISWLVEYLRGNVTAPRKRSGPTRAEWKNLLICEAIRMLVSEYEMYATRNDATMAPCACDVVADALAELRQEPSSYENVKRIWNEKDTVDTRFLGPA